MCKRGRLRELKTAWRCAPGMGAALTVAHAAVMKITDVIHFSNFL